MYADDVVLMAPSAKGLQRLIDICYQYGKDHNIKFNSLKSVYMVVYKGRKVKVNSLPQLYIGDQTLKMVDKCKYLGHVMCSNLSDSDDIQRQIRELYVNANMLTRKFSLCSDNVKILLFKMYCTPLYCSSLWSNYTKYMFSRIRVAYNNSLRLLLCRPRCCSASQMFTECNVLTLECNVRKHRGNLLKRLSSSTNMYVKCLTSLDRVVSSRFLTIVHRDLYTIYM